MAQTDGGDERGLGQLAETVGFEEIVRAKLKLFLRRVGNVPIGNLYDDVVSRVERPLLELVLEHAGGNQLRAARMLGMNRATLRKKLTALGLVEKQKRPAPRRKKKA